MSARWLPQRRPPFGDDAGRPSAPPHRWVSGSAGPTSAPDSGRPRRLPRPSIRRATAVAAFRRRIGRSRPRTPSWASARRPAPRRTAACCGRARLRARRGPVKTAATVGARLVGWANRRRRCKIRSHIVHPPVNSPPRPATWDGDGRTAFLARGPRCGSGLSGRTSEGAGGCRREGRGGTRDGMRSEVCPGPLPGRGGGRGPGGRRVAQCPMDHVRPVELAAYGGPHAVETPAMDRLAAVSGLRGETPRSP